MMCQKFVVIPRRESTSLWGEGRVAPKMFSGRRGVEADEMGAVPKESAVITS